MGVCIQVLLNEANILGKENDPELKGFVTQQVIVSVGSGNEHLVDRCIAAFTIFGCLQLVVILKV